ncbi:MAG: PocR ligand-binding domain-containing protein [Anaerolineaceae bacterium]|nr:PocR ligand-binding domain-containing protein [Anaerolineaceae bacterium]
MQYPFSGLVVIPDIQQILASFYSITQIPSEILDLDNQVRIVASGQNICDKFNQNIPQSMQNWWQSSERVVSGANKRPLRRLELPGGLFKYTGIICVENNDKAALSLGPVFHKPPNKDRIRSLAQELGLNKTVCLKAVREVPIVTEKQIETYLEFLIQLIQHLTKKGLNEMHFMKASAAVQKQLQKQERAYRRLEKRTRERSEELEKADKALQESEQRFRIALMGTPLVVFNQDIDLRYTWIYNPQNYTNQSIIVGKTDADLFAPEDAMRLTALKERVIGAGLLTREEVSLTIGGQTSFYDMTLTPLFDENGTVTGLTCVAADITKRKQIEEDIRKRLAESIGIQRIAKGLLQKIGLDEVLEIVCTEAMQLTGAKGSAVLLLDKGGWLRLTQRAGSPIYTLDYLPVEGTLAGRAIQTGRYVWAKRQESKLDDTADQWQGYPWTPGLLSMLSVPLKVDSQTIGVLNILDKPSEPTREDMRIIELFADQAAIIIEHVRLQQKAEQVAVLEERQRLARELHDSVTQALYSVNLYADASLLAFSRKQWEALEQNLNEVRNMAREAMYDMRLLVFELRPLMLEEEGLASVLQSRLTAVEARTGLKTEVVIEGERRLPVNIEEQLYQIVQEGLNNVVKHAKADMARVQLKYNTNNVQLEVVDNGVGFNPEDNTRSGGVGLQGIRERVQQSGGPLEIKSASGKGTCLRVTIPINVSDSNKPVEDTGR